MFHSSSHRSASRCTTSDWPAIACRSEVRFVGHSQREVFGECRRLKQYPCRCTAFGSTPLTLLRECGVGSLLRCPVRRLAPDPSSADQERREPRAVLGRMSAATVRRTVRQRTVDRVQVQRYRLDLGKCDRDGSPIESHAAIIPPGDMAHYLRYQDERSSYLASANARSTELPAARFGAHASRPSGVDRGSAPRTPG